MNSHPASSDQFPKNTPEPAADDAVEHGASNADHAQLVSRDPILSFVRRQVMLNRLPSYVRGEQSQDARRETSRLLDRDDDAYAEYRRVREADRNLREQIAPFGRPDRAQLDRSFAAIGAALNGSTPLYKRLTNSLDWRARVTALLLAILMLVPVAVSVNRVAAERIPTQPQPRAIVETGKTATRDTQDSVNETLTPELVTAIFIARATPAAPTTQ